MQKDTKKKIHSKDISKIVIEKNTEKKIYIRLLLKKTLKRRYYKMYTRLLYKKTLTEKHIQDYRKKNTKKKIL